MFAYFVITFDTLKAADLKLERQPVATLTVISSAK